MAGPRISSRYCRGPAGTRQRAGRTAETWPHAPERPARRGGTAELAVRPRPLDRSPSGGQRRYGGRAEQQRRTGELSEGGRQQERRGEGEMAVGGRLGHVGGKEWVGRNDDEKGSERARARARGQVDGEFKGKMQKGNYGGG
jgi:hypothetical protein